MVQGVDIEAFFKTSNGFWSNSLLDSDFGSHLYQKLVIPDDYNPTDWHMGHVGQQIF